ncbi:hypothetical protein CY34DRAFT_717826 [Suillus luteus UH-Slu-Lm8-n1]|uniref:Uncharacterized protein n=1 Tax=Suillus luteus UH-Slu-Lm8-n1 TaxID=930992 RepID=A0A0D0AGF8_9AGAM|nr:hypothetical protein CY34DRAFT_717826 [Suillus luteus UH-Slu-Lm8-n1]
MCYLQWKKTYRVSGIPAWNVHASDGSGLSICLSLSAPRSLRRIFNFILPYPSLWHITPTQPIPPVHARIHTSHRITIILSSFLLSPFFCHACVELLICLSCHCLCVLFT